MSHPPAPARGRVFVVGLTGGIGSGKSTVAEHFAELGAALVDTDQIAHALSAPDGAAIAPIRDHFGEAFITAEGALDRARMRALVFREPSQRKQLEAILHPLIQASSAAQIAAARCAGAPYVVLAIPLLVESGAARERFDRILLVDCPQEVQIERVMKRSGLSSGQVLAMIQAQASRAERLAVADDVIDNAADRESLHAQVLALHPRYLELAARQQRNRADSAESAAKPDR